MTNASVVAVVVTFRREEELRRLLDSLEAQSLPLAGCVVWDNGAEAAIQRMTAACAIPAVYVPCAENPGPGSAWKQGMQKALSSYPELTHFLVLDDDVVLPPETVARLIDVMQVRQAALTCPLLLDASGQVWGFPEPLDKPLRRAIRQVGIPEDSIRLLGTEPLELLWATGACVLVSRAAVEQMGFHRTDFWMLGEDLEFSMRVIQSGGGWFLPDTFVSHLPPPVVDSDAAAKTGRLKFCSLLQNLAYLSFHSSYSRHLKSYLPGNIRRYLRDYGWSWNSWREVAACLWFGVIGAEPAGGVGGTALRERLREKL